MIVDIKQNKFISKKTAFVIMSIIASLFIIAIKLYIILRNYTYLPYSFDTARILVNIGSVLQNMEYLTFPPRIGLIYLSTALKVITEIEQANILALPMIVMSIVVLIFIYILTRTITENFYHAIFALTFFAVAVSSHTPTSIILYSFVVQPLFIYVCIKYIRHRIPFVVLLIASIGAFFTYPSLFIITSSILSMLILYRLAFSVVKNDISMIKIYSNFFLLLPLTFITTYFPYKAVSYSMQQGLYQYLKNSIGFWIWSGAESYLYITVLLYLLMSLLLFSVRFIYDNCISIRIFSLVMSLVNNGRNIVYRLIHFFKCYSRELIYFLVIIMVIDLILTLFLNSYSMNLTYIFFSWAFHSELWRDLFSMIVPALLFSVIGLCLYYSSIKNIELQRVVSIYCFPVFFLLLAIFPGSFEGFQVYASSRGLSASYVLIMALFSLVLFNFIYIYINNKKLQLLFVSLLFLTSINISIASSINSYSIEKPYINFIEGMKWLEKNKTSNKIFYINADILPPPPPDSTFYGFSFIYSDIFDGEMMINNKNQYDRNDFSKFVQLLNKTNTDYIVVEPGYPIENLEKIKKLGNVIYENNEIHIIKYISLF